jgi:hypothetical protein
VISPFHFFRGAAAIAFQRREGVELQHIHFLR